MLANSHGLLRIRTMSLNYRDSRSFRYENAEGISQVLPKM
jgi:hypothetical protein